MRVTDWILQFCQNSKKGSDDRIFGQLTSNELKKAQTVTLKLFQKESFTIDKKLKCLYALLKIRKVELE